MRKNFFYLGTVLMAVVLASCNNKEKPIASYGYPDKEEVLSFCIEKTEYFDNRVEITFSKDSIDKAVQVVCFDENFKNIIDEAKFDIEDDVLTIYSDASEEISGLQVHTIESYQYINIRYLDSDSYAMLQYNWADDYGMMASGDKDSYYTEEEKRRRAEESAEIIRKNNEAFALIEGTWETKDGSKRLEIVKETINEIEYKKIKLFNSEDDETYPETYPNEDVRADSIRIINPQLEPVVVEVVESDCLDHLTEYYLYNNKTEMECTLTEGRFYKQS